MERVRRRCSSQCAAPSPHRRAGSPPWRVRCCSTYFDRLSDACAGQCQKRGASFCCSSQLHTELAQGLPCSGAVSRSAGGGLRMFFWDMTSLYGDAVSFRERFVLDARMLGAERPNNSYSVAMSIVRQPPHPISSGVRTEQILFDSLHEAAGSIR